MVGRTAASGSARRRSQTEHGWLLIYHGVKEIVGGSIYRVGLALLDLDEPTRVLHRLPDWILAPLTRPTSGSATSRTSSSPAASSTTSASDEIRLYYGAADTSICLATAQLDDLLDAVLAAPPSRSSEPAQTSSERVCFAAARFSVRRSLSDFCAGFLPVFFGFCEPFIV